ncbi:MAG: anaerobic carbon-monoxide dehydrogenase catalytic subunit [Candidatus Poribacteria bacterium]
MSNSEEREKKALDSASQELIRAAQTADIDLVWDRYNTQAPQCRFGQDGLCCRMCAMGPCRIVPGLRDYGACGADVNTVVARNFVRMIAGGSAAHSDHGRAVVLNFIKAARGEVPGYEIKDEEKLKRIASVYGIEIEGRSKNEIAEDVGNAALQEFGQQTGEIKFISRAPEKRQQVWRELGVVPRGIDREIVECMHRTTMGVDQDYENLMLQGTRAALADGWGGSMIATELQDIMFGTPGQPWTNASRQAVKAEVNLGILSEDEVNIVVHGHEPLLSEMIVIAAGDPELIEQAKQVGAKGINLTGICCTATEVLIRHGIPIAGNFLQQELALVTGAVEAMIVDVQCVMESLSNLAACYHTKLITTSEKAKIPGATHIHFDEEDAINSAKAIIREAIENYPNRGAVNIPKDEATDLIAGFSHEYVNYMLGGTFRGSYWPLNSNIIDGRIRGVAGVVGCNNVCVVQDSVHVPLIEELIANDVLVVQTGCAAIAAAKAGLMQPETAALKAGPGLAEVCEAVGIPPVLHAGACVDNSRILIALTEMVNVGKQNSRLSLGDDISELPVAGAAPEWMSEKAISIGQYFVASGVFTVFGVQFPTVGSKKLTDLLFKEYEKTLGGMWACEPDPSKMAGLIIDHIDKKRKALGIEGARERVLYDMEMRRQLEVE